MAELASNPAARLLQAGLNAHQRGALPEAERLYRELLVSYPQHPDALHLLGVIAFQCGHFDGAIELYDWAIAIAPRQAIYHHNLGNARREKGELDRALHAHQHAVKLAPRLAEAHLGVGIALRMLGRPDEALTHVRRALSLQPVSAEAHLTLGTLHDDKLLPDEAEAEYRRALALDDRHVGARISLAGLLAGMERFSEALVEGERALAQEPDNISALTNMAGIRARLGDMDGSIRHCVRLTELAPHMPEGYNFLGNGLLYFGRTDEAVEAFQRAIAIDPAIGDSALLAMLSYSLTDPAAVFEAHRAYGAAGLPARAVHYPNSRAPGRRLRIAYLSPDLRRHSVAFFIEPLLALHRREDFEVYCYYTQRVVDSVTEALRASADHWVACARMSADDIAARIRADGIDILIDLAGHTEGNNVAVLRQRPAPLQMTFLGYPTTTGLSEVDYRISDAIVDPYADGMRDDGVPEAPHHVEPHNVERLMRLRDSYYCYRPMAVAPEPAAAPLPRNGHVTFGSFNNRLKLGAATLALWARVLHALPDARLVLKTRAFASSGVGASVLDELEALGIARERVTTLGYIESDREHLEAYGAIDVALDTYPYNGATTTCEALWMGVPVVTLRGATHAARMGASILTAAGLDEWIADDEDDYVRRVVALVDDADALARRRAGLRAHVAASALMDEARYVTGFEEGLRQAWHGWCDRRDVGTV